jgi:hypothetical protein
MEVIDVPLVEISVRKGAFTDDELSTFGEEIKNQVVNTYRDLKGREPQVWVTFRELESIIVNTKIR